MLNGVLDAVLRIEHPDVWKKQQSTTYVAQRRPPKG